MASSPYREALLAAKTAAEILPAVARAVWADENAGDGEGCPETRSVEDFATMAADEAPGAEVTSRYAAAVVAYLIRSRAHGGAAPPIGDGVITHELSLCGRPLPILLESLLINGRDAAFAKVSGVTFGADGAPWTAPVPDQDAAGAEIVTVANAVAPWEAAGALGAAWQALVSPDAIIEAVHYVWKRGQEGDWPKEDAPVWAWAYPVFLEPEEDGPPGSLWNPDMQAAFANLQARRPASLPHPLAPLVKAWLATAARSRQWDSRNTAIIPAPFAIVRDLRSAQGQLFADGPIGFQSEQRQRSLPGFEGGEDERLPFGRVVPLMMFDATGALYESRGQGAPLALRLWVEAVTAPERLDRANSIRVETSLRELVRRLWPKGWTGPGRDGTKLLTALRAIDGARIPWPGGYWRAVSVVNMPDVRNPDSPVPLDVSLPPGSERGPLVYRNVLREYGVTSAPLYRLGLAVAYLWDRYFTHNGPLPVLVPVVKRDRAGNLLDAMGNVVQRGRGNGKPSHWNHPRAVRTGKYVRNPELSRIPDLRAEDLLLAAFARTDVDAMTPGMRRKSLYLVRDAAFDMAGRGHAVVQESGDARRSPDWRIRIEPPDWHGAPMARASGGHPASGNEEPATGNDHPASGNYRGTDPRKT